MTEAGYDPRSIANAIIEHAVARGRPVTHLAVQKLLYFSHASYLAKHRRPLVRSTFEAWQLGPVCRPIYDALRVHGSRPISELIAHRDPFTGVISSVGSPADQVARDHIARIMETLGHLSPQQLVDKSHVRGGAWWHVWEKSKNGVTLGNRIDDKLTLERFSTLWTAVRDLPIGDDLDEAAPFAGD